MSGNRLEQRTTPLSSTEGLSESIKTQLSLLQKTSDYYTLVYYQLHEQLGRPSGYLDLALALDRKVPQSFLEGQRALAKLKPYRGLNQEIIEVINKVSLYDRPITGLAGGLLAKEPLSLAEIEQLPLPLSEENKERMLAYFLNASLSRNEDVKQMRGFVGLFVIQSQLFAGEAQVDTTLKNLHWRLVSFFDFLAEFLVEFPPNERSEEAFLQLVGSAAISPILGAYLLARQDLTPASLVKLFLERKRQLVPMGGMLGWHKKIMFHKSFDTFIREIQKTGLVRFRDNYSLFNQETDTKAQKLLLAFYQPDKKSEEEQIEATLKVEELLTRIGLYRKRVTGKKREVGPEKVEFSGNNLVTEVEFIFKKSGVLTLLLHFKTGQPCSLAVEIDKDNRIFGLPPGLAVDYPNFKAILLANILPPILERLKEGFPEIEKTQVVERPFSTEDLLPTQQIFPSPVSPRAREGKPAKKKERKPVRLPTPLEIFARKRPPSRLPSVEPAGPKRVVVHSRIKVEEQLGRKNTEVVNRVMKAIRRFEQGFGDFERLKVTNVYRLRVGQLRVLLEPVRGNSYRIFDIGNRDKVYSGLMS